MRLAEIMAAILALGFVAVVAVLAVMAWWSEGLIGDDDEREDEPW